ncbi:acyltransferase [Rossellomorea aquimaris]|uniref:acyltransferase n=1 Tax=Rossellomorea aquimaris TaxID=189382 RepID=UPI0007D066FB|nr:acyltransferase [Rossellomorea aquimaris]
MSKTRGHITEIHFLRAIACLLVLLVHVSGSFYYEHGEQYNEFTLFVNQISRFGTPMFALISAFLLCYQTKMKGFNLNRFISSRFTKIGLPFLFWSVFYLVFMYFVQDSNPLETGKRLFLVNFAFGNSFYHLYFMSIVFQFYLLFLVLQLFRSKKSWTFLLIISIIINVYFLHSFQPGQYEGIIGVILSQRAFLPNWIFFFIFGGFLAYFWDPLLDAAKKYSLYSGIAVLLVVLAAVWEYKVMGSIDSNRSSNIINIPLITIFIIGIGDRINQNKWISRFLTQIGTLSMAIYLVHPFVLYCFQAFAPKLVWHTAAFPIVFVIILLGSIGMIKVIQAVPWNHYVLTIPKVKITNQKKMVGNIPFDVNSTFQKS